MNENCGMCEHWQEALDMLADYQRTGLTSEEVKGLKTENKRLKADYKNINDFEKSQCAKLLIRDGELEAELQQYKQAEADGRREV